MVKGDDDADQLPWLMKKYLKKNSIYMYMHSPERKKRKKKRTKEEKGRKKNGEGKDTELVSALGGHWRKSEKP